MLLSPLSAKTKETVSYESLALTPLPQASAGIIKSLEWTVFRKISLDGVPVQGSGGGRKKPMISSEYKAHVCLLHVGAGSIREKENYKWKKATRERKRCRNRGKPVLRNHLLW